MLIITIIFVILSIVLLCFCLKLIKKQNILLKQKDIETRLNSLNDKFNILIQNYDKKVLELDNLTYQIEDKRKDLNFLKIQYNDQNKTYKDLQENINYIRKENDQFYKQQKKTIEQRLEDFKKVTKIAADNYVNTIEKVYEHAEAGHAEKMTRLKEEFNEATADLQKLQNTRKAAHQALLKQKQIKENKDNYRLLPSSFDIQDIAALKRVKETLHKPRILSMLIWQTYYQPLAKEKFPIILQDKTKMGIYKITNTYTDQCYIGQSVDVYKRWSDHCKAGLGIDAPVGNKLYKAMQEDGLYNFTFQLLCQCSKEELDEKEKYFISLYQSDIYGYNGTKGNK